MRPDLRNRTDSYAPLYVKLQIAVGGQLIPIPVNDSFRGMEINSLGTGGWYGTLTLFDETFNGIEALILSASPDYQIKFSFGWDEVDRIGILPIYTGRILNYVPTFHETGTTLELSIVEDSVSKTILNRDPLGTGKPLSWPEGWKSPTEMVQKIAEVWQWKGRLVTEPSYKIWKPFDIKEDISAIKFITNTLLTEAVSMDFQAFVFYIEADGTIHFHSRKFQETSNAQTLAEDYVFNAMSDGRAEVISFSPQDAKVFSVLLGGGTASHVSIDSLQGTPLNYPSTQDKGTADATKPGIGGADSAAVRKVTDPSIQTKGVYADRNDQPSGDATLDLKRRANRVWTGLESLTYYANIEVRGTNAIDIMDPVRVRYRLKNSNEDHYLSGTFLIQKLKHSLGNGHWITSLEGVRDGSKVHPSTQPLPAPTPGVPSPALPITPTIIPDFTFNSQQAFIRKVVQGAAV